MPRESRRKRRTRATKIKLQRRRQAQRVTDRLTGKNLVFLPTPEVPKGHFDFLDRLRENPNV